MNSTLRILDRDDGTFADAVHYAVGGSAESVTVADSTATATSASLSQTTPQAKPRSSRDVAMARLARASIRPRATPGAIISGDFGRDGKTDIVVANETANTVS